MTTNWWRANDLIGRSQATEPKESTKYFVWYVSYIGLISTGAYIFRAVAFALFIPLFNGHYSADIQLLFIIISFSSKSIKEINAV